jgi:hypothetical protein
MRGPATLQLATRKQAPQLSSPCDIPPTFPAGASENGQKIKLHSPERTMLFSGVAAKISYPQIECPLQFGATCDQYSNSVDVPLAGAASVRTHPASEHRVRDGPQLPTDVTLISFGYGVQMCQPGLQNFSCNLTAPGGPMAIASKK